MERYSRLIDLLRPGQVLNFIGARWLLSSAQQDRVSGRTTVLALAHISSAIRDGSTELWDHAMRGVRGSDFMYGSIRDTLNRLGLHCSSIDKDVLRGKRITRLPRRGHQPAMSDVMDDKGLSLSALKEAACLASRDGYSDEEILHTVRDGLNEFLVNQVHDQ